MTTTYDQQFNLNEWYLIVLLFVVILIFVFVPKRFSTQVSIVFLLFGTYTGYLIDFFIGIDPLNFYDVNDSSKYSFFDVITYIIFGPWSYFYFYIYDRLRLTLTQAPLYILIWSCLGIMVEWISQEIGVYHYRHGYAIYYSLFIYIVVQSIGLVLYYLVKNSSQSKSISKE
jgi:hypothetical protein